MNHKKSMKLNRKFNIAILFGGISSEKEVSINSAIQIYSALPDFLNVNLVYINHSNFSSFINELNENTLVFNALHGGEGENGQIQSYLSYHKVPFTGSDATASMLAMNKHFTKIIATENKVLTPNWLSVNLKNIDKSKISSYKSKKIKFPVVINPNSQGSTLDLSIIYKKVKLRRQSI